MKRIVINGTHLCVTHSGIQRYMIECLSEIDKLNANHKLNIEIIYPSRMSINCPVFKNIKIRPVYGLTRFWEKYTLPLYTRKKNLVFVGMGNDIPFGRENVICLHDLIPIKPEGRATQDVVNKHLALYDEIAAKCKNIVTVSDYSKQDIIKQLRVSEDRVLVIPNGWQHITKVGCDDTIFDKYDSIKKGNYYYAMGNVVPYKNITWVV